MIPYGKQIITQADIDAVTEVLHSPLITQGPVVPDFEQALQHYCGARHAVAVNSATSALHIACLALELGPGDRLWTSPNTFVASANCALYCGATVDFVDIDPDTYNMCPEALAVKLARAEREDSLPKVVIPVHFAGHACDMAAIHALAQHYGFRIIEDASHAIGGEYRQGKVGSCRWSDITVFSFHPVKIITTAEGGAALTKNAELAERMRLLRGHGITRDPQLMRQAPQGDWYYEQQMLGFNYRMTELQAALGCSQIQRLDEYVDKRHELVAMYSQKLLSLPLKLPCEQQDVRSAWHLYPVQVADDAGINRLDVFNRLREGGIGANVHYIPVHLQPYYRDLGFGPGDFPVAEQYYARALSLPLHPSLTEAEQQQVVNVLQSCFQ